MRSIFLPVMLLMTIILFSCQTQPAGTSAKMEGLHSPNGRIKVDMMMDEGGAPFFSVRYGNRIVIDRSRLLGFDFQGKPAFGKGLILEGTESRSADETWEPLWGPASKIRNQYNELELRLKEEKAPNRQVVLLFRAYDDGIAFRYVFPKQAEMDSVVIMDEHTEFRLTGDHLTWWQPGDWDIYEHLYGTCRFTEIDALARRKHPDLAQTYIPENAVNTPVTMKTSDGLYLSFHEAALYNYAGMTLKVDKENLRWVSELVGTDAGYKVRTATPFQTPWRTLQIGEKAVDLIASNLILNLNEPGRLEQTDWIRPTKYMGIWWEMHLGKSSWDMASGKHGATTANAKRYIDFCAANNIPALLVEGWNTGWEHWIGFEDREGVFDFITPYPDYNLEEVVRYGKQKGVSIIMHHETSAAPRTYDKQLDTAFALCRRLGIHAIKTGYVGKIIPKGEYHQGQWMVNHYQKVLETAARYQIAVDAHETIKDTGIRRTWPNFLSREVMRGQEFNAWASDGGNPPEHLTVLPFTIGLGGPIDYTPGIFNIKFDEYKKENQVNTTLAQQLALYVVIYSPLQMAADLPEHYQGQPAFQFIRDVPVDWDESYMIDGEPGDFLTIARKEKGKDNWFLGSITDENPRDVSIRLDFLPEGKTFTATLYTDGPNAHWNDRPVAISITTQEVTRNTVLKFRLAPGGGAAVSIK